MRCLRLSSAAGLIACLSILLSAPKPAAGQAQATEPSDTGKLFQNAKEYNAAGDYDRALELFQKLLNIQPASVEALNGLGEALVGKGMWQKAVTYFYTASQHQPVLPAARKNLARAYAHLGQWQDAILAFRLATAVDPADFSLRTGL